MQHKKFHTFLESIKEYNPFLINTIMEAHSVIIEAEKNADPYSNLDKKTTILGKLNDLPNPNYIQIGQKLKLPDGSDYIVVKGDTLSGIAHGKKAPVPKQVVKPQVVPVTKNTQEQAQLNASTVAPVATGDIYPANSTIEQKKAKFIDDWIKSGISEKEATDKWNSLAISMNSAPKVTQVKPVQVVKSVPAPARAPKVIVRKPVARKPQVTPRIVTQAQDNQYDDVWN